MRWSRRTEMILLLEMAPFARKGNAMNALARWCGAVLALVYAAVLLESVWTRASADDYEALFRQAQADPSRRAALVAQYTQQRSLPEYVQEIAYSDQVAALAITHPLRQYRDGEWGLTTNTRGIGKGYPSFITFGPRMFSSAFNIADFESVLQHEATHARYWATGRLTYMERVDTDEARLAKGVLPILFELDALKAQIEHPAWRRTSPAFRKGQEAYKQKWMDELNKLRTQLAATNIAPLLDRIWNNYR
jgi:hypothetical protein